LRVNEGIRASTVRLIGPEGEQLGIVSLREALEKTSDYDLDLVEVAAQVNPPVCRIMDFSKYKYEQEKREREAKKHRKGMKIKEMRLRPMIDQHDYQVKLKRIKEFLEEGDKVRVRIFFRGREMAHQEMGRSLIDKVVEDVAAVGKIDKAAQMLGRSIIMVLSPKGKE